MKRKINVKLNRIIEKKQSHRSKEPLSLWVRPFKPSWLKMDCTGAIDVCTASASLISQHCLKHKDETKWSK